LNAQVEKVIAQLWPVNYPYRKTRQI